MDVSEIKSDLARGELRGIERAFRALITGRVKIKGVTELGELAALLHPLCAALAYDDRRMPDALAAAIRQHARLNDETFAGGARAVGAQVRPWQDLLGRFYPELSKASDQAVAEVRKLSLLRPPQ